MEKNSGKGDQGQRVKVMDRGGDSSEGQNNLEGESVRLNSPLGNMEIDYDEPDKTVKSEK